MIDTTEETGTKGWGPRDWGMLVGVALALLPMLVRLQSPLDLLPYWDGDPLTQEMSVIGLTPSRSLLGDIVSVVGAALLLACAPRRSMRALIPALLVAAGAYACLYHMPGNSFDAKQLVTGGAWLSGVIAAFALWYAGKDRRVRLVTFALIVGAVGLLAVKGVYQVAVEHPATVEAFQRDKAGFLSRNGWTADSSMARSYERRLMQAEATGWFGFANIYASFAAMGVAVFGVMMFGAWRSVQAARDSGEEEGKWPLLLTAGGFALSAGALVMAGAKGGYAAAALGLGIGALLAWLRSRPTGDRVRRLAWAVGPAAIAAPLAAVVVRGIVGERIGELSLLFRWFYMQGAARIFSGHWLHGVGPDNFQAAYAMAKNPLSPEDVTSPHSLLWDWAACLGIGGVIWGAWLICISTRIGPAAIGHDRDDAGRMPASQTRVLMRAVCLIAALGAMVAIPTQYAALLPEEALGVRIGGLVVWCVLSCGVLAVARAWSGWPIALAAGAAVLVAHSQIEITGMWIQSCGLVLAIVGLAASACGGSAPEPATAGPMRRPGWGVAVACIIGCAAAAFMLLGPMYMMTLWQARLQKAYTTLEPVRDLRSRIAAAERDRSPEVTTLAKKLREIEPGLILQATRTLPRQWPTSRSASQLSMQLAEAYTHDTISPGSRARALVWAVNAAEQVTVRLDPELEVLLDKPALSEAEAVAAFERLSARRADGLDSLSAGWAATICIVAADGDYLPSYTQWREQAVKYLTRARAVDPYNPMHAQRLMDTFEKLGRKDDAARAAKELLEVDALQRLDRAARGLSEKDKARAERIAAGK